MKMTGNFQFHEKKNNIFCEINYYYYCREDAITKLDGYELKGKKLKAFKIRAAKDPMIKGM